MLEDYLDQILEIYNYVDALVMTNEKGFIEYYRVFNSNGSLHEKNAIGRHILEIHPTLTEETSSIMRVLKTGKPIFTEHQYLKVFKGKPINAIATTLPIKKNNNIIGVVDFLRYLETDLKKTDIEIILKDNPRVMKNDNLYRLKDIITKNVEFLNIKDKIRRISQNSSSVLIYGKTGTGKELVAQSIHTSSNRINKPFVSQNCGAIPATLLESILFGTVKGSYTGAEDRKGLFELADGGTIFLDELNSMDINMQSKLLTVIENRQIRRIGDDKPINVDVRIISAVNEEPRELIKNEKLREDLFYRLGVVQINLPTLSERKEDILSLCNYFVHYYNGIMGKKISGISKAAEKLFLQYSWPGNVRELRNVIEGAFNISKENILTLEDLPDYIKDNNEVSIANKIIDLGSNSLSDMIEDYEKNIILKALETTDKLIDAAKLLNISRQSLRYKIDKYKISV